MLEDSSLKIQKVIKKNTKKRHAKKKTQLKNTHTSYLISQITSAVCLSGFELILTRKYLLNSKRSAQCLKLMIPVSFGCSGLGIANICRLLKTSIFSGKIAFLWGRIYSPIGRNLDFVVRATKVAPTV